MWRRKANGLTLKEGQSDKRIVSRQDSCVVFNKYYVARSRRDFSTLIYLGLSV